MKATKDWGHCWNCGELIKTGDEFQIVDGGFEHSRCPDAGFIEEAGIISDGSVKVLYRNNKTFN